MFSPFHRLGQTGRAFPFAIAYLLVLQLMLPWQTRANPMGGNVVAGAATINGGAGTLTVNQASQRAVINWQDFSIQQGELTKFVQPNLSAAVLNRVIGSNLSGIYGTLQSNGQVYLINPNGIVVGPTGVINTGGFVASTLDVDPNQFMGGGDLTFKGNSTAKVVNLGKIGASNNDVILIAQEVENSGEIKAPNGTAGLAAGHEVLVKASGQERIFVQAGKGKVSNSGLIESATVELKAAGGNEYALAINNEGTVRATGVVNEGGRILLKSGNGKVRNAGTLTAMSAKDAKADVRVLGKSVELAKTSVIEAPGGFVETSGETVNIADGATVRTQDRDGTFGTWLIDPTNFTVSAGSGAQTTSGIGATTLSTNLGSTIVQITTSASGAEAGDIFVNAPVSWAAATTLTLTANGSIYVNAPVTASNAAGKLALQYGQGAVATGNTSDYYVNAPVNLQAGPNFSTKRGSNGTTINYTVITSLGAAGSTTGADLQGIRGGLSGNYVLGADIDASATSGWNGGAGFEPIGNSGSFSGTFDGLGHRISGLFMNRPSGTFGGLFGLFNAAVVRNVGLEGGSVTAGSYSGGLVAFNNGGSITRSYSTANVTGTNYVGGLVGYNNGGSITQSYATGNVSGTDSAGGLVGRIFGSSTIFQSYATGSVTSTDAEFGGGLVGTGQSGNITQSYATGQVIGSTTGGLIGSAFDTTVAQSYWNTQTSGQAGSGGGTGLTTAQMKTQSSFTGWDFAETWRMIDGVTYPLLKALSKSIGGTAYSDAGVTNVGSGVSIQMAANGLSLGSTATAAGGTFQFLVSNDQANGLLWIDNSVSVKGNTILSSLGTQNLDLWGGYVRAADGTSNSIASTAKGALSDTDILFTSSGNNLTLATNTKYLALGAYTLNGNLTAQGTGTLDFNGAVTLTANSALTTANQNISFGSSIAGNFGLTLAAGTGNITTQAVNTTVNVGTFRLNSGNWSQNSATLPSFVATDFQFAGGTFLRVTGGNGTTLTPYQIADVYGLQGIGGGLGGNYVLSANIEASATSGWNTGAGFSPIGNGSSRFTGRFDGLGYTINGLGINRTGQQDVGLFGGSGGTVQNVGLVGGSMAGGDYAGSLVGRNYGTVTRSFSTANVTSNGQWVGGLVGAAYSGSIVSQSYATGNVSGTASVGGLVGLNSNAFSGSAALIQQSYATGGVSGSVFLGGLVGQSFSGTTITESYATGGRPVLGSGAGSVTNSYSVGNGITLAQLEAALPAGFDSSVWGNAGNQSTPYIKAIALSHAYIDSDPGTTALYQIIQNVDQLQSMSANLAGRYALGNAIDASDTSGWNGGLGFSPVGNSAIGFSGVFDGLGYNITGLTINRSGQNYVGLFGATGSGAQVRNVGLTGGSVTGSSRVGGLVGSNRGSITQSYATGSVSGIDFIGGLVGYNEGGGGITRSYATGSVTGSHDGAGGLAGWNDGSIAQSYATGSVVGINAVAGLIGENTSSITQSYATGSVTGSYLVGGLVGFNAGDISLSYATGSVAGNTFAGGLVGQSFGGSITNNSYWATDTTGQSTSDGGIGRTLAQLEAALPTGFDPSIWGNAGNHSTPYVKAVALSHVYIDSDPGAVRLYRIIQNVDQLQSMSGNLAERYALGNNIDAVATSGWNGGLGFTPIGNVSTSFTGVFDGLSYVISGLTINRPSQSYVGLFGAIRSGAVVRNVGLSGGSVSGEASVGGLVGASYYGTVSRSYSTASVSAISAVGGLIGLNQGSVDNSYATGSVSGNIFVGGLVGYQVGFMSNSYATGSVSGSNYVGGLLGGISSGSVDDSYWNIETSGQTTSAGGIGKTTAEMQQLATFSGWSISNVGGSTAAWRIYEGDTTPLLRAFLGSVTASVSTGGSKGYDGTDTATGVTYSLSNPLASRGILGTATYTLDSPNAGNRTATLAGLYSGQQGYDITFQSAAYTVDQRAITVSTSNVNRGYDGTTDADGTAVVTLGSLATGDSLGAGSFIFDNRNAGIGKTVIVNSVTINDGNSGNNYSVTLQDNTTSSISAAALTVTAQRDSRVYNGTASSSIGPVVTGSIFGPDTVGTAATQSFDNKNVGAGKTLTAAGLVMDDGNSGNNYVITYVADSTGVITHATLDVTAGSGQGKIYGNADPGLTYTAVGLFTGDSITGSQARAIGENVGTYAINPGTLDAGTNYLFNYTGALFAITPRSITVTAESGSSNQGTSPTNPGISLTDGTLGFSDTLNSIGLGNYFAITNSTGAGTYGIPVTGDNANYTITKVDGNWIVVSSDEIPVPIPVNPDFSQDQADQLSSDFQASQANDENDSVDEVTGFTGSGESKLTYSGGGTRVPGAIVHVSSGDVE